MTKTVELVFKIVDQAQATLKQIQAELRGVDSTAKTVDRDYSKNAVAGLKKWQTALDQTKEKYKDLEAAAQSLSDISGKIFMAGAAALAAAFFPIKEAATFERSMSHVKAIMADVSDNEFKRMTELALELGRTTRYTASEAADAFVLLAQAGFTATEAMQALPGVLELAQAGSLELAQAADIAVGVLTGMGLKVAELGRVNDVLAVAAAKSNASVAQLGEAMQVAGPAAKGSGVAMEEVVAVLEALHNAGIKGSEAGNNVKRMLIALQDPSKEAAETLERLNIQVRDQDGNFRGLIPVIEDLGAAQLNLSDASSLFGLYTAAASVAVAGQASKLQMLKGQLIDSRGAAAQMAIVMEKNLKGALIELEGAVESLFMAMAIPLLSALADVALMITRVVQTAANLVAELGPVGPLLLGLVGGFGLFAVTAGGLGFILAKLMEGFVAWKTAAAVVGPVLMTVRAAVVATASSMLSWSGVISLVTGAVTALRLAFLAHPILLIATVLAGVVVWLSRTSSSWMEMVSAAQEARAQADGAVKTFGELEARLKGLTEGSEEFKQTSLAMKDGLLQTAKSNAALAVEARNAAASINEETGAVTDGGEALRNFKTEAARQQLKAMGQEIDAQAAKFEQLAKPSWLRVGGEAIKRFFLSWLPGIGTTTEHIKELNDTAEAANKEMQGFAKAQVAAFIELGRIDPSMSMKEFRTALGDLGGVAPEMQQAFVTAFAQIKIAAESSAQAGTEATKKSTAEQRVLLQRRVTEERAGLESLIDVYNRAAEASRADPASVELVRQRTQAYKDLQPAIASYMEALTKQTANEVVLAKRASEEKKSAVQIEVDFSLLTKEQGNLQMLALTLAASEEELAIKKRVADEVASVIGKESQQYQQVAAAVSVAAQKAADDRKQYAEYAEMMERQALVKFSEEVKKTYEQFYNNVKSAYDKALGEVKKYEDAVLETERKIADSKQQTSDTIRELGRKTLSDEEAWNDRRKEAAEKLAKAQSDFAALGAQATKEEFAGVLASLQEAQSLFVGLAQTVQKEVTDAAGGTKRETAKSIEDTTAVAKSGVAAVGELRERVLEQQRDAAKSGLQIATKQAEDLKAVLDKVAEKREVEIKVTDKGTVQQLQDELKAMIDSVPKEIRVKVTTFGEQSKAAGGLIYKASGGKLPGYGGGDRVRAVLEAGEFVVRKEAVRKYGVPVLNALNMMRLGLADSLHAQLGGVVLPKLEGPRIGYQTGGLVEGLKNMGRVELAVGGQAFPVIARQDVIAELKEALQREHLLRSS